MNDRKELIKAAAEVMDDFWARRGGHRLTIAEAEAVIAVIEPMIGVQLVKRYTDGLDAWEERIRADERQKIKKHIKITIMRSVIAGMWSPDNPYSLGYVTACRDAARIVRETR